VRTNTLSHLKNMCAIKDIVCEKTRGRIELTTPDGSTTAECATVEEALAELKGHPFAELPIKLAKSGYGRGLESEEKRLREFFTAVLGQQTSVTQQDDSFEIDGVVILTPDEKWLVETLHHDHGTYWEPPSSDTREQGQFPRRQALEKTVALITKIRSREFFMGEDGL